MDLGLKNKVVIVSGGASGIGLEICHVLMREEAIPVIVDRKSDIENTLVHDIKNNKAHIIKTELNPPENCKKIIDETIKIFGRIDALVNNAGDNDKAGLEKSSPEDFFISVEKNLLHYYSLTHYALGALKRSQGAIVNISSKVAVTGQGNTSGYAAAKGAQLALTREWAIDLRSHGIRVNAILPAEVMTPAYAKWLSKFPNPEEKLQKIVKNIPLGQRLTTTNEIASMAAFLLSGHASHITGQFLYVDGGYVHLDRALAGVEDIS